MKRVTQWLLLSMVLLAIATALGTNLYFAHRDIEANERARLIHQTNIIQRNLSLRMQTTSNALEAIRNELPELLQQPAALERRLHATVDSSIGLRTLLIVNRDGNTIASNRRELLGVDMRAGERYKTIAARPDPGLLYVSPPFTTPLGIWAVSLGRMLPDAQGNFNGYILAIVDPPYFDELMRSVLYAPDVRAGLTHAQGKVAYRVPDNEGITGMDLSKATDTAFYKHMQSGADSTFYPLTSTASGQPRMVASQTVRPKSVKADQPLIAFSSREVAAVFAPWRQELVTNTILFGLFALASFLGLAALQRRQRVVEKLQAAREQERTAAEQELRHAAKSLQLAVDGGQLGVWERHFASNRYVLSERCYQFLGLPAGSEFNQEKLRSLIHPDDIPRLKKKLAAAIAEKKDYSAEYRVVWPDGSLHWLALHGHIKFGPDGSPERMDGTAQDITERQLADERLRQSEEKRRLATEGADVGVWYWDHSTGKLEWSERCKQHFGLPLDQEASFEHFYAVLHADDRARVAALLQRSQEILEDFHTEYRVVHPDGSQGWIEAMGRYFLDDHGSVTGMGGVTLDITVRKEAERQIAQGRQQVELFNVQLEKRAIDAETAKRAKDAFLRAVSHELRTPLNHIIGGTDILLRGQPDAQQEKWLRAVKGSANDLFGLVQQILLAARDEGGEVQLEQVEFAPATVLEEVRLMQLQRAQGKGLTLTVAATAALPARLTGDPTRLAQALLNYVDNAIKFTAQGSVTLGAEVIAREAQGVTLRFTVTDTGIGIAPEVRDKLFTAFAQGDGATTREYGGLGIGLSNTRELAKLMGGEVGVDSVAGGGASFWLTARFGLAAPTVTPAAAAPAAGAGSGAKDVASPGSPAPAAPPVADWVAVRKVLNQLEPMLVSGDLQSQELLRATEALLNAACGDDAARLRQAAEDFDFDAALAVLHEITNKMAAAAG